MAGSFSTGNQIRQKNGLLADCVNQSSSSAHAEEWSAVAIGLGSGFCHFVKFSPYNHSVILTNAELLQMVCLFVGWFAVFKNVCFYVYSKSCTSDHNTTSGWISN